MVDRIESGQGQSLLGEPKPIKRGGLTGVQTTRSDGKIVIEWDEVIPTRPVSIDNVPRQAERRRS